MIDRGAISPDFLFFFFRSNPSEQWFQYIPSLKWPSARPTEKQWFREFLSAKHTCFLLHKTVLRFCKATAILLARAHLCLYDFRECINSLCAMRETADTAKKNNPFRNRPNEWMNEWQGTRALYELNDKCVTIRVISHDLNLWDSPPNFVTFANLLTPKFNSSVKVRWMDH